MCNIFNNIKIFCLKKKKINKEINVIFNCKILLLNFLYKLFLK